MDSAEKQELEASRIIKLDESVVNRIAAGEIIQHPSNCVKELIENSIDAKAKQIQVITKLGGLKSIQIVDNGTGILNDSLAILCERFTTSKLTCYDDLRKMQTYGFRGEALASISMISRLTVQTKTRGQIVAHKAKYEGGKLCGPVVPVAGNQGTIITIDDLFYNVPIRKKISSSGNDQFAKIFDIISKYAIHNHKISFTLKKFGENNSIKSQPSETPIDAIRIIFGNSVAKALIHVFVDNIGLKFKMIGYISKADFDAGKKSQLILFINHRLVESKSLKRALFGDIYKKILADSHPFIYMAIEIAPENVDVNVSPTKHEVHFLNEELIVESIKSVVEETLLQSNQTRVLYAQQLLPGAPKVSFETSKTEKDRLYAKDMIRTDPKEQSIVKFLKRDNDFDASISQIMPALKKPRMAPSSLDTISNLLAEAVDRADTGLMHQIRKLKFVGSASRRKSLIQCENLLYLVDNRRFAEELFYQALLKSFSNFNAIEFKKPLKIKDLVTIAKSLKAHKPEDSEIVDKTLERLMDIRELLGDYFKISINDEGELLSIPILVPNYAPLMAELPTFITRLGRSFDYEDEKASLQSICKELAQFYSKWSLRTSEKEHNRLMEDVIFHRIRLFLFPPKEFLSNGTILKLTSLQDLYKVFERC